MCHECQSLAERYYPDLSNEDRYEVLIGATAFPFASPRTLEVQLRQLRRRTDGSLDGALAYADRALFKTSEWLRTKGGSNNGR